jgi:oligopeptide transport system permease protein
MSKELGKSLWADARKRLFKNKVAIVSLSFILTIVSIAIFANFIAPFSYETQNISNRLAPPSFQNWMGTDILGRDLLSRILYGARMSLSVGIITAFCSLMIGTIYGSISGYIGGHMDNIMMRIVDILYTFPSLLLIILITLLFGKGVIGIFVALTIVGWVSVSRIVRGQILQVKEMAFVEAARSIGTGHAAIVLRHILPNIIGPIIVTLTFEIPAAILSESFLSFIGLGLKPPFSSWGTLANDGFQAFKSFPNLIIFPGFAIFFTVLSFNLLGDGMRDAFDPKLNHG